AATVFPYTRSSDLSWCRAEKFRETAESSSPSGRAASRLKRSRARIRSTCEGSPTFASLNFEPASVPTTCRRGSRNDIPRHSTYLSAARYAADARGIAHLGHQHAFSPRCRHDQHGGVRGQCLLYRRHGDL